MNKKLILLVSASLIIHFSFYAAESRKKDPEVNIMVLPNMLGVRNPIAMLMLVPGQQAARITNAADEINTDLQIGIPAGDERLMNFLNDQSTTSSAAAANANSADTSHRKKRAKYRPRKPSIFTYQKNEELTSESIYSTLLLLAAFEQLRIEDDFVAPAYTNLTIECINETFSTMFKEVAVEVLQEMKMDSLIIKERTAEDGPWTKPAEVIEEIIVEQNPNVQFAAATPKNNSLGFKKPTKREMKKALKKEARKKK